MWIQLEVILIVIVQGSLEISVVDIVVGSIEVLIVVMYCGDVILVPLMWILWKEFGCYCRGFFRNSGSG